MIVYFNSLFRFFRTDKSKQRNKHKKIKFQNQKHTKNVTKQTQARAHKSIRDFASARGAIPSAAAAAATTRNFCTPKKLVHGNWIKKTQIADGGGRVKAS